MSFDPTLVAPTISAASGLVGALIGATSAAIVGARNQQISSNMALTALRRSERKTAVGRVSVAMRNWQRSRSVFLSAQSDPTKLQEVFQARWDEMEADRRQIMPAIDDAIVEAPELEVELLKLENEVKLSSDDPDRKRPELRAAINHWREVRKAWTP